MLWVLKRTISQKLMIKLKDKKIIHNFTLTIFVSLLILTAIYHKSMKGRVSLYLMQILFGVRVDVTHHYHHKHRVLTCRCRNIFHFSGPHFRYLSSCTQSRSHFGQDCHLYIWSKVLCGCTSYLKNFNQICMEKTLWLIE